MGIKHLLAGTTLLLTSTVSNACADPANLSAWGIDLEQLGIGIVLPEPTQSGGTTQPSDDEPDTRILKRNPPTIEAPQFRRFQRSTPPKPKDDQDGFFDGLF